MIKFEPYGFIMPNFDQTEKTFRQAGFFSLEILLAMCLLVFIFFGAGLILSGGNIGQGSAAAIAGTRSLWVDSSVNSEALLLAQAGLEKAQAQARKSFFEISEEYENESIYTKKITADWVDDYIKKIKSAVAWKIGGRNQSVELETLVTSPANAIRGDTCNPDLSGNWLVPELIGSFDFTDNAGATDLDVRMRKIYLTTDPVSSGKDDFYIINIDDPLAPEKISSINTGIGLLGVVVNENYAYVITASTVNQLQIIDIGDLDNPRVISELEIKNLDTGADCGEKGKSICYKNGFVYLGLVKDSDCPEFNVIDVSNPLLPFQVAGWEAGAQVTDIKVENNVAYLAIPYSIEEDEIQPIKGNLISLNIENLDNIQVMRTFSAKSAYDPGIVTIQPGESIFLDGDILYFGRSVGGPDNVGNHELFVLNKNTFNVQKSANVGASVNAMVLRNGFLFITTSDANSGFQIWDIVNMQISGSLNIQQASAWGMDCEENLIYIAKKNDESYQIIGPKTE